jgi:hypothetical protein
MERIELQTIERQLRRIADALERISPPPPAAPTNAPAPRAAARDRSEPEIGTMGF